MKTTTFYTFVLLGGFIAHGAIFCEQAEVKAKIDFKAVGQHYYDQTGKICSYLWSLCTKNNAHRLIEDCTLENAQEIVNNTWEGFTAKNLKELSSDVYKRGYSVDNIQEHPWVALAFGLLGVYGLRKLYNKLFGVKVYVIAN